MNTYRALIIDDEPDIRTLIAITLQRMGVECHQAANVREARQQLQERRYHLCITDMKLPDGNGLELINLCQQRFPDMPVAMITAFGNMDLGVNALKSGAFDVVAKPLDTDRLRGLVHQALELTRVPLHLDSLPSESALIGQSGVIRSLKQDIGKVARTQAPVFLSGEAGTGKELAARLIHHQSSRAPQPFMMLSCQERQQHELEQALFGHNSPEDSLLCAAHGGTLFLEAIDHLPAELQVRLLRVLQEKNLYDHQTQQTHPADFRLISASDKDPALLLQDGILRQDFLFRINVVTLTIPPLRERRDDIPMLAEHFIRHYSRQWGMPDISLDEHALQTLLQYDFPGNVSELENLLQRAVTLAEQDVISAADLQLKAVVSDLMPPIHGRIETANLEDYLDNIERRAITQALTSTRWNKTAAAEKLGISFRALRYRCKKLGID